MVCFEWFEKVKNIEKTRNNVHDAQLMHVHEIINSKNNNNNLNNIVISNNDSNFIDFKALADSNVNIDKRRKNYRSFDTSLGKNGKNLTELDSIYSSAHLNSNFLVSSKIDSNYLNQFSLIAI
jgi:hypothetical protein